MENRLPPLVTLLLLLLSGLASRSQALIRDYVRQNQVAIQNVEPDSTDYSDLEPLGKAIGDARLLMLGEQDHGDAPVFLAKTRMIKYLHEKKGFNVLAFESDFFSLTRGWDSLPRTKAAITRFLTRNIFPIWTGCNTCHNLFYDYIPGSFASAVPLEITGFDDQLMLDYSYHNFARVLDSALRRLDLPLTHQSDYASRILPLLDSSRNWFYPPADTSLFSTCDQYLRQLQAQLALKVPPDDYWLLLVANLIQANRINQHRSNDRYRENRNDRDQQMALNLAWLARHKYPGQKILVWAANYHIARYADSAIKEPQKRLEAMGSFLARDSALARQTYILGFDSYEGTAGRLGYPDYTITKPRAKGFENWIDPGLAYAFVDFRAFNRLHPGVAEPFFMKGFGHMSFERPWANTFDGVFFIRKIYPCLKK